MSPVAPRFAAAYRSRMRPVPTLSALLLAALILAPATAMAQAGGRYAACLAQDMSSEDAAIAAYVSATNWEKDGGGAQARHCAAIAALRLGFEEEAAAELETLAGEEIFSAPDARAELLRQAASAWLLAGRLEQAEDAASAAVGALPGFDTHVVRARVRMEAQNYPGAETDLDAALSGALSGPQRAEALVLRSQAHLGQSELSAAQEDAQNAVRADPQSVDARLALGDAREAIRTAGRGADN